MSINRFDLLAIGGGPAAQKAAIQASKMGKKAAIIEKDPYLGGGCVHYGTIPSKSLQETSRFYRNLKLSKLHGLQSPQTATLTLQELMFRASTVIEKEEDVTREQMIENRVTTLTGWGTIIDAHHVEVTDSAGRKKVYETENILIATGSSPRRPTNENIPFEDGLIYDSDGLFAMKKMPTSLAVVGAGIIGSEYATIFSHIGVQVHLFDSQSRILGFLDEDVSGEMARIMQQSGISIHVGSSITNYKKLTNDEGYELTTNKGEVVRVQQVLISRGRLGNVDNLGLESVGIIPNDRKQIIVNENYQTNISNIYACGDVIGFPSLASVSMYQGAYVAKHMFGYPSVPVDAEEFPIGIYTLPEIATIGPTEEALQARGVSYGVGMAKFDTITRAQISGDQVGLLKILFDKQSRRVLGVHIISDKATELIALGQCVVNLKAPIEYFTEHIFNYPTMIGAYKNAANDALLREK
ncbi:Si-specific NAD(P)(+) transhydrogenase [Leptospira perdikensis]|uniref:Soluble pyridine nucleotide transhydrogenase n=1 Tax=Leptospira perdikensis TaxID=2484948 RepID=A0A4R9JGN7_9LEPT|nr:Si-specific NAD(P)(+) transhydrogenase [Leptospira perdikensis]TGL41453.1 Si-specific NAD(P)(+) transhydrogenase [Leptospira perdikensis]